MAERRSSKYDWFKGTKVEKNKKDEFKQGAKTTWKFTKIFLYFSLFFFSMWGCVQVFTHKLGTSTASGVTFAIGDRNLSPQENKIEVKNRTGGTADLPILNLATTSMYETRSKEDGDKIIDELNKTLKDDFGVGSPTDAQKGGNYIIRFKDGDKFSPYRLNDKLLLFTTAKNSYTFEQLKNDVKTIQNGLPDLKFDIFYVDKTSKKVVKEEFNITEALNNATGDNRQLAYKFNYAFVERVLSEKLSESTKTLREILLADDPVLDAAVGKLNTALTDDEKKHLTSRASLSSFAINSIGKYKKAEGATPTSFNEAARPYAFNSGSNWKPMTNWAQAWKVGVGPFYGLFVYPLSFVTNAMVDSMPIMEGWESFLTIVMVVIIINVLMFALNFKNTLQQTKMQELSAKKAIIDAKYTAYKGNKQMEQRQRQEVSAMYKKEGISPLSSLGSVFISMPFFLAIWRVIGSIDHIKGTTWIGIKFSATSWREWFGNMKQWEGGWVYFPLLILAGGSSLFSQYYPKILTRRRDGNRMNVQQKEAMKKGNKTQTIMMFVFAFMSLIFSAGLQVYFIVRSLWKILEIQVTHHILVYQKKKRISLRKGK